MNNVLIPMQNRGILKITGSGKHEFLQGLITNNIYDLQEGRGLYSALLTPQGKFLHDFFVYEQEGVIYLTPEMTRLEELKNKLLMYKLGLDVYVEIGSGLSVYAIFSSRINHPRVFPDPRLEALGFMAILSDEESDLFSKTNELQLASFSQYDLFRTQLGIPDGSRDIRIDKGIILENGLDELHAISWTKGCYMGQELTARTKHRGLVRKRLLPVLIEGGPISWGEEIFSEGLSVGEMRSSIDNWGLALLRLESLGENKSFESQSGSKLTPHIPEWTNIEQPLPQAMAE